MNLRTIALVAASAGAAAYAVHRWHQAERNAAVQKAKADLLERQYRDQRAKDTAYAEFMSREFGDPNPFTMTPVEEAVYNTELRMLAGVAAMEY